MRFFAQQVLDAVAITNHIKASDPEQVFNACEFLAADTNGDGDVNILDVVSPVNKIIGD